MKRILSLAVLTMLAGGCHKATKSAKNSFDADAKIGLDTNCSAALTLLPNRPHTDEISWVNQDQTDWYRVELKGRPNPPVLTLKVNWENVSSDVRIDVYDELGQKIATSPVRDKGVTQKKLLTQIDKPGFYYVRVTAPTKTDGTVYTVEVEWAERIVDLPPPGKVVARVVSAYREGDGMVVYIDKGWAAGIHVGDIGSVLNGDSDNVVDDGELKIVKVLDANKSVGHASMRTLGKNNRVTINAGK